MTDGHVVGGTADGEAPGLAQARADLADTIESAGLEPSAEDGDRPDDLAKVGGGGLTFELRYNGTTIALDGNGVNRLSADDFQPFLQRQKAKVEAGDLDDVIRTALQQDGPMKALARVRAVDTGGDG